MSSFGERRSAGERPRRRSSAVSWMDGLDKEPPDFDVVDEGRQAKERPSADIPLSPPTKRRASEVDWMGPFDKDPDAELLDEHGRPITGRPVRPGLSAS